MKATGPLGSAIETDGTAVTPGRGYRLDGYGFRAGVNPLIMMTRVAFFNDHRGELDADGQRALLRWAADHDLGQDSEMVGWVEARRDAALEALRRQGLTVRRFRAEPEWRLAVGLGNKANPYEIGLSLHGTYGCPVIPATSLKGLAAAWAVASDADPIDVRRVLGTPRLDVPPSAPTGRNIQDGGKRTSEPSAARGTVCFLEAIPSPGPVEVCLDVLTPHVKPYYDDIATGANPPRPPAEYHNPVPVNFLTVRGTFAVDLYGADPPDVALAGEWLAQAGAELGAGGKTAAGYGYLIMTSRQRGADTA